MNFMQSLGNQLSDAGNTLGDIKLRPECVRTSDIMLVFVWAALWTPLARLVLAAKPWEVLYKEHAPESYTTQRSQTVQEYGKSVSLKLPGTDKTPDFRQPEPVYTAYLQHYYREENRPYLIKPGFKTTKLWDKYQTAWKNRGKGDSFWTGVGRDNAHLLMCYCTTVYKRLTPLGGCAVITTRHILTTATSTDLVLRGRRHYKTLENILGAWYETNEDTFNASYYMTPARIHFHPKYNRPSGVNSSHPLPCLFDLSVWAATYRMYSGVMNYLFGSSVQVCNRGGSHRFYRFSTHPTPETRLMIVGFQLIWNWRRIPMPWYKYAIRIYHEVKLPICPKTEWGWFFCLEGMFAPLGLDSGAALHGNYRYRYAWDGLIAMNSFSMKLRSRRMVHYFTPVDNHEVLDFLYNSYMGRAPYDYLDWRFYDTQWHSPVPKPWFHIPWVYPKPANYKGKRVLPFN